MFVSGSKNIYKCFSCGAGGDALSWMMNYHRMSFPEAIEFLASRAGIKLTKIARPGFRAGGQGGSKGSGGGLEARGEPLNDFAAAAGREVSKDELSMANQIACDFFRALLRHPEHGQVGRALVAKRQLSVAAVEQFLVGVSPDRWDGLLTYIQSKGMDPAPFVAAGLLKRREADGSLYDGFRHRLMFPIVNSLGQVIAFGGRKMRDEDEPKYLNSPESAIFRKNATLYAMPQAAAEIRKRASAVVVEGYMDAIACHQAGVTHVIATLGTALTIQHARILSRQCERAILMFDGDAAGLRAADRAVEVLFASSLDVRIATMESDPATVEQRAKDPDELVKQPGGVERLEQILKASQDALAFRLERLRRKLAGADVMQRARAVDEELARLVELGLGTLSPVQKQVTLQRIGAIAGVSEQIIRQSMQQLEAKQRRPASDDEPSHLLHEHGADLGSIVPKPADSRQWLLACVLFEPEVEELVDRKVWPHISAEKFPSGPVRELASFLAQAANTGHTPSMGAMLATMESETLKQQAISFASAVEQQTSAGHGELMKLVHGSLDHLESIAGQQKLRQQLADHLARIKGQVRQEP
jgi:DNA primase